MEFRGFNLLPAEGRLVDPAEQEVIGKIIENEGVLKHLPRGVEVLVEVGRRIEGGLTPAAAHNEWRESYFPNIATPPSLPRQPLDAITPSGLVHVTLSVIEQPSQWRNSHYGFEGYFLSLLVSLTNTSIWDARGERAT